MEFKVGDLVRVIACTGSDSPAALKLGDMLSWERGLVDTGTIGTVVSVNLSDSRAHPYDVKFAGVGEDLPTLSYPSENLLPASMENV